MTTDKRESTPSEAEHHAWYAYRAFAEKQGREVDERTFRDAWQRGCHFAIVSTSRLSPALERLLLWVEYVTDHSPVESIRARADGDLCRCSRLVDGTCDNMWRTQPDWTPCQCACHSGAPVESNGAGR